jgi:hypothetical protein
MPERKPVFLNGAAFWRPLLHSGLAAIALKINHVPELSVLLILTLVVNLGMFLSCLSAFGRQLGRTTSPYVISLFSSFAVLFAFLMSAMINNYIELYQVDIGFGFWFLTVVFGITFSNKIFYLEDMQGQMICRLNDGKCRSLLERRVIPSDYQLMRKNLFGASVFPKQTA